MLREIAVIGALTALETRRQRILPAMAAAMALLLAASLPFAAVTMGSTVDTVVDLGLAAMSIILNLLAILLTAQSIHQERERRTLHILLPRLRRPESYLPGKFLGIALPLTGLLGVMSATILCCAGLLGWHEWWNLSAACLATAVEIWIAVALTLLFSNATSQFLSIFGAIAIDVAGHFSDVILRLGTQSDGAGRLLVEAIWYLLPNLSATALRDRVWQADPIAGGTVALILLYGATEAALLLTAGALLHARRPVES
ncbi:MAG: hypothetical protein D6682_03445 [Zetaproteobacteria bacterium]|nr:MAG: hypothetical protein D6682_03445 [Zetaproteobacteria bacterium]